MTAITATTIRLLNRLPRPLSRQADLAQNPNAQLLQIPGVALERQSGLLDQLSASRSPATAYGGMLERYGNPIGILRDDDLDLTYRIRILAEFRKLISKGTRNEIIQFVASALNVDATQVKVVENVDVDTSAFRARYYYVEVPIDGLIAQGIEDQAEITAVLDTVEALLDRVEGAGIRGVFKVQGVFAYAGDDADFGPATGGEAGTDATGYWNDAANPDYGPVNSGGFWGGNT